MLHIRVKKCIRRRRDTVYLRYRTDAHYSRKKSEYRKYLAEPFPFFAETVLDIIERSAEIIAVFVLYTVLYCKKSLCVFRSHSEKCRKLHPEKSSRTSCRYRCCYTDDISCSDRRRKSRTQCRKARYFATSVLLVLNHILQRSSEPSYLKELQPRREQHTAYHYEDYERKSPYIAVCYAYKIIDLIQRCTSGFQTSLKLYHKSPVLSMSIRAIISQRP